MDGLAKRCAQYYADGARFANAVAAMGERGAEVRRQLRCGCMNTKERDQP